MAINREFWCPAHGDFENATGVCPHGCTVAEREFRTAPAFHNGTTRRTDDLVRSQVEAFGLTDIRSAREGETSRVQTPQMRQQADFQAAIRKRFPSNWGKLPTGDNAISETLAQYKAPAEDNAAAVRGMKHSYQAVRDPDNMQVDVSKAA